MLTLTPKFKEHALCLLFFTTIYIYIIIWVYDNRINNTAFICLNENSLSQFCVIFLFHLSRVNRWKFFRDKLHINCSCLFFFKLLFVFSLLN